MCELNGASLENFDMGMTGRTVDDSDTVLSSRRIDNGRVVSSKFTVPIMIKFGESSRRAYGLKGSSYRTALGSKTLMN